MQQHDRHLRREVHDALDGTVNLGDRCERREDAVRDVALDEMEPIRARVLRDIRALAGAEVVEHDDAVTARDQRVDRVRSDETTTAGDDREGSMSHARTLPSAVLRSS